MSYTELPYVFDLLWDIKSVEHLHEILLRKYGHDTAQNWELEEEMITNNIPFPEGYVMDLKDGFPTTIWIDNNGTYQTYAPCPEEAHRFQRMRKHH